MRTLILIPLLLLLPGWGLAQSILPLELHDTGGRPNSYRPGKGAKAFAMVFLLPDCPACQSYSKTLNNLYHDYQKSGLELIGVFPGKFATAAEAKVFRETYQVHFPLYMDHNQGTVRKTGATVAPEVFLYRSDGRLVYSGRIDDWMISVGKKRLKIKHHDLREAVNAVIQGRTPAVQRTTPVGCLIEQ